MYAAYFFSPFENWQTFCLRNKNPTSAFNYISVYIKASWMIFCIHYLEASFKTNI